MHRLSANSWYQPVGNQPQHSLQRRRRSHSGSSGGSASRLSQMASSALFGSVLPRLQSVRSLSAAFGTASYGLRHLSRPRGAASRQGARASWNNRGIPAWARSGSVIVRCLATTVSEIAGTSVKEPVVSVEWLHANLKDPNIKVLDASWYLPNEQRNPVQEYQMAHIPGALFFDVDGISDKNNSLPHMLPSEEAFAAAVSALGIENNDGIIVYDGKGIFSAARVWWMFRVFGHDKVCVLDGGLPRWRASGFDVESSASGDSILKASAASEAIEKIYQGLTVGPITFQAKLQHHLIWDLGQIKQNIEDQTHQHVDARSKARFDGAAPEPRKGIRSGHVPRSKCLPFTELLDTNQTLLHAKDLSEKFHEKGISLDRPIVASCGTGVTACVIALGLHRLGKPDVPIYDGSWTEWGAQSDTPVATS